MIDDDLEMGLIVAGFNLYARNVASKVSIYFIETKSVELV